MGATNTFCQIDELASVFADFRNAERTFSDAFYGEARIVDVPFRVTKVIFHLIYFGKVLLIHKRLPIWTTIAIKDDANEGHISPGG